MSLLILIRLMLTFDLCLVCVEGLVPGAHDVLPIGGSHIVQAGAALIVAFVVYEIVETGKIVIHSIRKSLKQRKAQTRSITSVSIPYESSTQPLDETPHAGPQP